MTFDSTLTIHVHIRDIGDLNMYFGVIDHAEYESDLYSAWSITHRYIFRLYISRFWTWVVKKHILLYF